MKTYLALSKIKVRQITTSPDLNMLITDASILLVMLITVLSILN